MAAPGGRRLSALTGWLAAGGALGLLGLASAALAYLGGPPHGYRTLAPEAFHPTFYPRFAEARVQEAAWVRIAAVVASEFVGRSRLCPDQRVIEQAAGGGRATIVVERICPYSAYSAATLQEFRVELRQQDGAWEVRWAGLRMKCALNRHPVGAFLVQNNPFRSTRAAWAAPLETAIDWFAKGLNPWMTECI